MLDPMSGDRQPNLYILAGPNGAGKCSVSDLRLTFEPALFAKIEEEGR